MVEIMEQQKSESVQTPEQKKEYFKQYHEEVRKQQRERVTVTLTKLEHRKFSSLAKKTKKSIPETIKTLAMSSYDEGKYLIDEGLKEQVRQATIALRQIGNNINQLTRSVNEEIRITGKADFFHLQEAIVTTAQQVSAMEKYITQSLENHAK